MSKRMVLRDGKNSASSIAVLTEEIKEIFARINMELKLLYEAKCKDYK